MGRLEKEKIRNLKIENILISLNARKNNIYGAILNIRKKAFIKIGIWEINAIENIINDIQNIIIIGEKQSKIKVFKKYFGILPILEPETILLWGKEKYNR